MRRSREEDSCSDGRPRKKINVPQELKQLCIICIYGPPEEFHTSRPTWSQILQCVLYSLRCLHPDQKFFSLKLEIVAFIEDHWDLLRSNKERDLPWRQTVKMTLSRYREVFENGYDDLKQRGFWRIKSYVNPYNVSMYTIFSKEDEYRFCSFSVKNSKSLYEKRKKMIKSVPPAQIVPSNHENHPQYGFDPSPMQHFQNYPQNININNPQALVERRRAFYNPNSGAPLTLPHPYYPQNSTVVPLSNLIHQELKNHGAPPSLMDSDYGIGMPTRKFYTDNNECFGFGTPSRNPLNNSLEYITGSKSSDNSDSDSDVGIGTASRISITNLTELKHVSPNVIIISGKPRQEKSSEVIDITANTPMKLELKKGSLSFILQ